MNKNNMGPRELTNTFDKYFFRNSELNDCKTQEEKDRLKDRWVIEDAASEISRAIRSRNSVPRLFGLF